MGNVADHKRKAHHNETFLALIQRNDAGPKFKYPDWMVTLAFYVALQYVDAKLAGLHPSLHPSNHAERNSYVASKLSGPIADIYFFLKGKSEFGRYFPDSEKKISAYIVNRCVNLSLTKFV